MFIYNNGLNNNFNETQATGIPMCRDELKLAARIIPKAKHRDNFGSNSPLLAAGAFIFLPDWIPVTVWLLRVLYSFLWFSLSDTECRHHGQPHKDQWLRPAEIHNPQSAVMSH
jgi:hypothetical protein